MSLEIKPLSEALGAEIAGVDLAGTLTGEQFGKIEAALYEHAVLLFRKQDLSAPDQLRFAGLFGALQTVRTATHLVGEDQAVMHVANRPVDGKPGILPDGEMQFHADQCYYERPARATMLFAREVPPKGGNTRFLNAHKAYMALPDALKARIAGRSALNVYDYDGSPTLRPVTVAEDAPRFVHPVVIAHPETGRPSLFVNRLMSDHIVDMDGKESAALLSELFEFSEREDLIYEHVWRPGDLVIWDNFAVMHARTDFDPAETRILRRAAVQGVRPEMYEPAA